MAGASQTDDASDIFWPGYVDAVTNLAINLLFVIAVMAIVVISATLQISKMKPMDASGQVTRPMTQTNAALPAQSREVENQEKGLTNARMAQQSQTLQAPQSSTADPLRESADREKALQEKIEQLLKKIQQLEKQPPSPDTRQARGQGKTTQMAPQTQADLDNQGGVSTDGPPKAEVVQATQRTRTATPGKSELQDLSAGGVVVVFGPDVIELSDAEAADLVRKLGTSAPIKGSRWQLRVVSPKGFSEATRLAYYRLNAVRNILIKNGAAPGDIEMRVVEAEAASANNARVLVRLQP